MSSPPRRRVLPTVRTLGLILLLTGPTRAEGPRGTEWIAADAIAFIEVARPGTLLDRLTGDVVRGLLEPTPAYRDYLDGPAYRDGRRAVDAVAGSLGTTWDRGLRDLVGGGLVLAVEPGTPPRLILVVTPGDPAAPAKVRATLHRLARLDALLKRQPDPVRQFEHRGFKGDRIGPRAALALVDGAVAVADSEATLRLVIDRSLDRDATTFKALAGDPEWHGHRRAQLADDRAAWGLVRLDRLRQLDPKALAIPDVVNPLLTLLFADWVEQARKAPWAAANLGWTADRLGLGVTLPAPPGGFSDALRRYLPTGGRGAPAPTMLPGTVASVALSRDLASLWEVRADLFPPEVVQGFAQLDTLAGTLFGGRDFGTGVLGALGPDLRLVIARQDVATLDPVPDDRLPAFALVADLRPDDEEFAIRLRSAFQAFVGLTNLNAAQTKAPPLMLGSEDRDGTSIATARYLKPRAATGPVDGRYNFSPSAAQVGDRFVLSSGLGLARDLVHAFRSPAPTPTDATLLAEADGAELAALIIDNRTRLVMQNMLDKGNDPTRAGAEVDFLARLARTLGRASFSARDDADGVRFRLDFATGAP